ncbi:Nn.00g021210.m01.CDS01 [Neocucurbitaria sp. VM-36]
MSDAGNSSPLPLEIEEILNLYRTCFEATVKFCSLRSISIFQPSPFSNNNVWEVYQDRFSRIPNLPPPDMTEKSRQMYTKKGQKAYKKWNLCDTFCLLLHDVLKKILKDYGALTLWAIVRPRPELILVPKHMRPAKLQQHLHYLSHSVFFILKDKRVLVFDGSVQQYGWNSSTWLLDSEEFWEQHGDPGGEWHKNTSDLEHMRQMICAQDNGYWSLIFWSFSEMFEQLDWGMLKEMSPVARVRYVRAEAERRASAAARATWG